MSDKRSHITHLLTIIVEALDIPESQYEKAAARHKSLGEWLCRRESEVAHLKPHVSPQGSFRYGTVVRPITADAEYDLDNVTTLSLHKTDMTQRELKELYGREIKAYAAAHGMTSPVVEKNRCWRLAYADEVSFHLDSLPSVPEDAGTIERLIRAGVAERLARRAVAITDRRHPKYNERTMMLLSSNPRGFALWFEDRAREGVMDRLLDFVKRGVYASVEDVPSHTLKSPLQRSVQILKRHRDVMFKEQRDLAPISMILTNLAAQAYEGEQDLAEALAGIVERIPAFVRETVPRVPNPADPAEDYADKWRRDPTLERNFWMWHDQAKRDIEQLPRLLSEGRLDREISAAFGVHLSEENRRQLGHRGSSTSVPPLVVAPTIIRQPPKPWGDSY